MVGEEENESDASTGLQDVDRIDNDRSDSWNEEDDVNNDDGDNGDDDGKDSSNESADVSSVSDVFDELEVGWFGPDDVCFYGEVGLWKDSVVNSQMVNGLELQGERRYTRNLSNKEGETEFHAQEIYMSIMLNDRSSRGVRPTPHRAN